MLMALDRNVTRQSARCATALGARALLGHEIADKTLALSASAASGACGFRARALGMRTVAYEPFVTAERSGRIGDEHAASIEAAAGVADVVSLHLPVTPDARLIDAEQHRPLMRTGRDALSNAARGAMVTEEELVDATCDHGHIRGERRSTSSIQEPIFFAGGLPLRDSDQPDCSRRTWRLARAGAGSAGVVLAEQAVAGGAGTRSRSEATCPS